MLVRIANRETAFLEQSELGLLCLSRAFWQKELDILEHLPGQRHILPKKKGDSSKISNKCCQPKRLSQTVLLKKQSDQILPSLLFQQAFGKFQSG